MVCIREDKIVINDYIENDPLSEENLDKTLETVNRFRLSFPNKSIWIYSGYSFTELFMYDDQIKKNPNYLRKDIMEIYKKRQEIVKQCTVMVDGRYIDSQRNPSKKWAGSDNQRVIDVQESLRQGKVVLYCD